MNAAAQNQQTARHATGVRVISTLLTLVIAFFLAGTFAASAQTAPSADDLPPIEVSSVAIDVDGASDGADAIEVGGTEPLAPIELAPAQSKEITPEQAVAEGIDSAEVSTSPAGIDGAASVLWIIGGTAALLGGAWAISRIGRAANN